MGRLQNLNKKAIILLLLAQTALMGQDLRSLEMGLTGGWVHFIKDQNKPKEGMGLHLFLQKQLSERISVAYGLGYASQKFEAAGTNKQSTFSTDFFTNDLSVLCEFAHEKTLSPYFLMGIGAIAFQVNHRNRFGDGQLFAGAGLALRTGANSRFMLNSCYHWTSGDEFDDVLDGKNDRFLTVNAGFTFELLGRSHKTSAPVFTASLPAQAEAAPASNGVTITRPEPLLEMEKLKNQQQRVRDLQMQIQLTNIEISQLRSEITVKDQLIQALEMQVKKK